MPKYFAKLDENNIVTKLALVAEGSAASEAKGEAFLRTLYNEPTSVWKQYDKYTTKNTSTNGGTPFRGNGALVGGEWDEANQVFWDSQPYPSWTKDTSNYSWRSPVDFPSEADGYSIVWNEPDQRWDSIKFSDDSEWYWNPNTSTWIAK